MQIKKDNKLLQQFILLGIFFGILLGLQAFIRLGFGDDMVYIQAWNEKPLDTFLKDRYEWWSSRIIIEAVMMPLVASNPWIWRFLNILMVLLLVWNAADLFGIKDKMQAQILFFILMWSIPISSINSAGWITTTTNYLWVMILGLVAMRPLKHWLLKEKLFPWEFIVCPVCIIYAANMEQMGAILLGCYLLFGCYLLIVQKKLSPLFYIQLILIVLSLYSIFASPGNAYRNQYEAERCFPEFLNLNILEKLLMGFLETTQYYLAAGNEQISYVFPLLTGILFALILSRSTKGETNKWIKSLIVFFPLAFYWGIGHLGNAMLARGMFPFGGHWVGVLGMNRQLPGLGIYSAVMVAVQVIVYLLLLFCTGISIYFIHGKSKETLIQLILLAAGLLSRIVIGFSPTIYASGDRTALFCSMAILIVTLRNLQFFLHTEKRNLWKIPTGAYLGITILCSL